MQKTTKTNPKPSKTTPRPPQNQPGHQNGSQTGPRRNFSRFGSFGGPFGVPWGTLRGAFAIFLSAPGHQEPQKKRHIRECLFAGPILHQIFLTFYVTWILKSNDSVWEGCSKPHFRPRSKKTRFWSSFGNHLGPCWGPLGPKVFIFSYFFRFFPHRFFHQVFDRFWDPPGRTFG